MIEQNSTIDPFTLNDQFGKEHTLEKMPKLLICSFGKDTGVLISNYFNAQDSDYLEKHDIKLMADVSSVPSLLRKTFILPKMKKYSFEVLISTDSKFSELFPKEEDKLTVLKLENGVVKEIVYVANEAELKKSIEL
ncbi:FAD/FMN-containing dehydrogenases [hydrothermal vent metagenome]|uniref:FAD/FMN-containing dehydrogenases n=1 Tax=hydrothermal vent metagenome TaxID=652676 RepID=A0A1W1C1S3_9ZZZZ